MRLTEKTIGCFKYRLAEHKSIPGEFGTYDTFFDYSMAVKKLGEYEDAEEQGLLVRLPCKVGDVVYRIHTKDHVEKHRVIAFHVFASGLWFWDENGRETPVEKIGKTVFLTREEAEAALKGAEET